MNEWSKGTNERTCTICERGNHLVLPLSGNLPFLSWCQLETPKSISLGSTYHLHPSTIHQLFPQNKSGREKATSINNGTCTVMHQSKWISEHGKPMRKSHSICPTTKHVGLRKLYLPKKLGCIQSYFTTWTKWGVLRTADPQVTVIVSILKIAIHNLDDLGYPYDLGNHMSKIYQKHHRIHQTEPTSLSPN